MNCLLKYNTLRSSIKTGDIILFVGSSYYAKLIQWVTKSIYTHVGIAVWFGDRLMIYQATAKYPRLDYMRLNMSIYKDFKIINLKYSDIFINNAVEKLISEFNILNYPYNYFELFKIFIHRVFNINLPFKSKGMICSEITKIYTDYLNITEIDNIYLKKGYIFPGNFVIL